MKSETDLPDDEFLRRFEDCTLPYENWTHRSHIRVAYLYLSRYPYPEAVEHVRAAIQRFNHAKGVPEGPTEGYNETTTQAFLRLVASTMAVYGGVLPTPDSQSFCDTHSQLLQKHLLRLFYSPERRLDPRGKHAFLEPDLAALPAPPLE